MMRVYQATGTAPNMGQNFGHPTENAGQAAGSSTSNVDDVD